MVLPLEHDSKIVPRLGVVRIDLDQTPETGGRFIEFPGLLEDECEVIGGLAVVWTCRQCRANALDGLFAPSLLVE